MRPHSITNSPTLAKDLIYRLNGAPEAQLRAEIFGHPCNVSIVIPHYLTKVQHHYADVLQGETLRSFGKRINVPCNFTHFGAEIRFDRPSEVAVHDSDLSVGDTLREMIAGFGPVILKNAYLPAGIREKDQRNIFPHLSFHYDRGSNQPTQYSLFSRDPFDGVQRAPRMSSTVFIDNVVAILQATKEGSHSGVIENLQANYRIFRNEVTDGLPGKILLEHAWNEPAGTGEISILDNRTVLHASYYRDKVTKGYPIGVRYLR